MHSTKSVQAVVYSSETESWSNIVVSKSNRVASDYVCGSVNVEGICYWNFSSRFGQVIKFEARNNEFTYLGVPSFGKYVKLVNVNDCLARIEHLRVGKEIRDINIDVFYFNEERSLWSKIYTINTGENGFKYPKSCFKNGGMIFSSREPYLYDPKSNDSKSLALSFEVGFDYNFWFPGLSYTPSLVALEGMKSLHL